ncbi:MAG: general secretion pathway protein GspK [Planctomycetes bacterium]|nr:general secretion pathway protein GspK [Planctomycetota bacterium]
MSRIRDNKRARRSRGSILIITIWVTIVLASLALIFARTQRVTAYYSANTLAQLQASMILDGAVQYVEATVVNAEGMEDLEDELLFEAMEVEDAGYFWVIRPPEYEMDRFPEYGLVPENCKLNLNTATVEMLQMLPDMTTELAASIIDWRDEDDEITEGGAESEYYLLESSPYACKNMPFERVEELLLVKDATSEVLYGEDTNLNGMLDDHEDDGELSSPLDDGNGTLEMGLFRFLTVYSSDKNVDAEGAERINVSDSDARSDLQSLLEETFDEERALAVLALIPNGTTFENVFDFYFRSGLEIDEFEEIADRLTTSDETDLPGLININRASWEVLQCLPGLEESDVELLLNNRPEDEEGIAWVVDVLEREKAVPIGALVTGRSSQYSADIVSVNQNGRGFQRAQIVIDPWASPAKIVYWKSISHMGWPLDREILETLRAGEPLE